MLLALLLSAAAVLEPGRELEALKPLEGAWSCKTAQGTVRLTIKRDLGGLWQSVSIEQPGHKGQKPHQLKGYWGYDAGQKKFVRALFGSLGEADSAQSDGWDGDKLVWTGEQRGAQVLPVRHTFVRKGPRALVETVELQKNGAWVAEGACEFKR